MMLTRLLPGTWRQPPKPAFFVFGLLFAPMQSALHISNVAGLAASLLLIALYLLIRLQSQHLASKSPLPGTEIFIAVLLTLALCIKPTLAPIVLLYLLWSRLWKALAVTVTLGGITCAIFPLFEPNWGWLATIRSNIDFLFTVGVANLDDQNLTRFDRIDLQLPLYILVQNRSIALAIAVFIAITLTTLSLTLGPPKNILQRMPSLDEHLLRLSSLLVIGLLPIYQRYYSAILLLVPVLWAFRNLALPRARWILALCTIFLVNTSVLFRVLDLDQASHNPITHTLVQAFIEAHVCWLLLAIATLLVLALRTPSSQIQQT